MEIHVAQVGQVLSHHREDRVLVQIDGTSEVIDAAMTMVGPFTAKVRPGSLVLIEHAIGAGPFVRTILLGAFSELRLAGDAGSMSNEALIRLALTCAAAAGDREAMSCLERT